MLRIFIRRRRRRRVPSSDPAVVAEVERLRAEAKAYLPGRIRTLAEMHGFDFHQVRIKHNLSNWGSCSTLGNINLNLNLMRVPPELQDYVMLHELCHLRYMNHGPEFHALLESVCPHHRELGKALRNYKLI